jgi:transposase
MNGVIFAVIVLLLLGFVGCMWSIYHLYPTVFKQLIAEVKKRDMETYDTLLKKEE